MPMFFHIRPMVKDGLLRKENKRPSGKNPLGKAKRKVLRKKLSMELYSQQHTTMLSCLLKFSRKSRMLCYHICIPDSSVCW